MRSNRMHYHIYASLLVSMLFMGFTSMQGAAKKPWTLFVYMAAANSLSDFASFNLQQMMQIGSNSNVNIVVFLILHKPRQAKITVPLFVQKGSLLQVGELPVMDSGSRDTFMQAMQWAVTQYPSDHLAVVLWNHGSGPLNRMPSWLRGICYDDDTGSFLTDLDCKYVFDTISRNNLGGRKIDIVACDACLMAGIEIAYAWAPSAQFLVASQETIPGNGYNYTKIATNFAQGTMSTQALASSMVDAYKQEYTGKENDFTLSLIDLSKVNAAAVANDQLATLLATIVKQNSSFKRVIQQSVSKSLHFTEKTYMDLIGFYNAMLTNIVPVYLASGTKTQLVQLLQNAKKAVSACILNNVHGPARILSTGLSIYFPDASEGIQSSYPSIYWSGRTQWLSFLQKFVAA